MPPTELRAVDLPAPSPQTGAWIGHDADGMYLIRQYADGTMTAERKIDGRYTGEVTLEPEQGWWSA